MLLSSRNTSQTHPEIMSHITQICVFTQLSEQPSAQSRRHVKSAVTVGCVTSSLPHLPQPQSTLRTQSGLTPKCVYNKQPMKKRWTPGRWRYGHDGYKRHASQGVCVALMCVSLMTSGVEHLFIWACTTCMSSLGTYLFKSCAYFLIKVFWLNCRRFSF